MDFDQTDDVLVKLKDRPVRYCGTGSEIRSTEEIKTMGECCTRAFELCNNLERIIIPSSMTFHGRWVLLQRMPQSPISRMSRFVAFCEFCFQAYDSLSSFTFSSPSHLRELIDVPQAFSGVVSIPDSVEV
jgi:hypothetical protein